MPSTESTPPIPRTGVFRDAAEAKRHGELRVAVSSARNVFRGGRATALIGALVVAGVPFHHFGHPWWSAYYQAHVHMLDLLGGVAFRITLLPAGNVLAVPWEVVAGAALIPVGMAVTMIGKRLLALRSAAYAKEFPDVRETKSNN